ncbi:uncharacterized protein LOC123314266 [Coccinella septempunctata]|uniref:uncharacterized protein LOC123314266 n=1 Tax=Coccinella septempunctata TaxID=41139 RepID=UPI001D08716E|nr:uncharacterized protein LOC123314266 [Coccinella septempunctata]
MAYVPSNPNGICLGMDISVGAFQSDEKREGKKGAKFVDGFSLGTEFFHGILPQWKFLEEKYFEKWGKKQIEHKQRLKAITKKRLKDTAEQQKYSHNVLLCLTGPEWYQELSPQQKQVIDNLKTAIKKDLDSHLTKATHSSLSLLGMRPLPNDSQLWRALTKSFGCPVEFLMVLYQLIKPQRMCYSINDRLILSGVAHLCLRDTLREMHVRSPSPPRKEKKPAPRKPKPKKKKYGSVYLVPFTFEWPQRRSDKYKNPVIQRPTSPYFSYICDFEPVRLRTYDDLHQDDRLDEDIKIPCDVFEDHLVAEEYYNLLFKRSDSCKYIILRPRIYESSTPKTYPGILPKFMIPKKYPPPIKLILDVKIYDEINMKNQKKRKVIRTICEVRMKPGGRSGQSTGQNLIAKYVYIMNIGEYIKKIADSQVDEEFAEQEGGDYPCSICGGPDGKKVMPEIKPIKEKSWIKRPKPKKKPQEIIYTNLSDFMEMDKKKIETVDEETKKLIEENKKYVERWNTMFDNIARMEKLKLDTGTCVCPGKTKDKSKFDPEIDCTCAIWNIPTPPKPIPPKISCECNPKLEEEYIPVVPKEDKCDCKQKAREKALEKCEKCGKPTEKTEEELAERGVCECTRILDACGNCVKEPPIKYPLLEGETKKECECKAKPPEEGKEVTVAYVFIENKMQKESSVDDEKEDCGCRHPKHFYEEKSCSCKAEREAQKKKKEDKKKEKAKKNETDKKTVEDKKEKETKEKDTKEKDKKEKDTKGKEAKVEDKTKQKNETKQDDKEAKTKGKKDDKKTKQKIEAKPSIKEIKCLVECGKILELDHCRRETEKLLNLLKCSCPKCKDLRRKYRARYVQAGTRDGCGGILPVIGGVYGQEKECECLEKFEKRVKGVNEYKERLKAKVELKSQKDQYVISGVHQTHKGPIYNLTGVIPKSPCTCEASEDILAEKQEDEKLTTTLKPGFKHVIHGVKGGSGSHKYIIGSAVKECGCSQVYEKFMKEHNECLVNYERYLNYMRKEIQAYMEDMNERYKDPPLTAQKLIENEIKKMTGAPGLPLPEGKSEFLITGVQANQLGKSFILGGMLLNGKESDECTIAVESYTNLPDRKEDDMTKCQRNFLCNYMTFGKNCGNPFKPTKEIDITSSEEIVCQCISYESLNSKKSKESVEEEEVPDTCACECPCGIEKVKPEDCTCAVAEEESEESCFCAELEGEEEEEEEEEIKTPDGCTCGYVEPPSSGSASDPCLCGFKNCGCQVDEVCVKECFYGPMEAWWSEEDRKKMEEEQREKTKEEEPKQEEESEESVSPYGGPSKRYVVLRRLPTRKKQQNEFIQKLLKGLADDGFPLAMLPDSHRLPHFWLWMQFRLKKKWNYDDAVENYRRCQVLWNHIAICRRKIPYPKLPVHCVCEANNYTWREAQTVSRIVGETKEKFYNKLRSNMVDYAREFYSTISAYQYPNPPYLNHYFFAYQPGKVENVLAKYIWEGHEHKNPEDYKSCFCK